MPPGSSQPRDDGGGGERPAILAAAVADRVGTGYVVVQVVDALGRARDGFVTFDDDAMPLTDSERDAIVAALAPATVTFTAERAANPDVTELDPGWAEVTIAAPAVAEGRLTVRVGVVNGSPRSD